jgi:hypothetical protein
MKKLDKDLMRLLREKVVGTFEISWEVIGLVFLFLPSTDSQSSCHLNPDIYTSSREPLIMFFIVVCPYATAVVTRCFIFYMENGCLQPSSCC